MNVSFDIPKLSEPSIVTVGVFDGIHRGHNQVLVELIREGDINRYDKIVFTFKNHPLCVINPPEAPLLLTTSEEKIDVFSEYAIQRLILIDFNKQFSRYLPEDFIKYILIERLNMKELILGYDASFGRNKSGDVERIKLLGEKIGYKVKVVEPYSDGTVISSSIIRGHIMSGRLKEASFLLGRPYSVIGRVVRGEGIGHKYGFPTVNLSLPEEKLIPSRGVYGVKIYYKEKAFIGVANVGEKPTLGNYSLVVEVNILDFNLSVYNEIIKVEFLEKIRDEKKFSSMEELYLQIKKDISLTRKIINI